METVTDFLFLGSKNISDVDCRREIESRLLLRRKAMTNLDSLLKKETSLWQAKSIESKGWFSSSQVWMWELDHKEGWVLKNQCFWTKVLEKTLESPLDCKEIKPVNPKGNQPWVFIGRTDDEAEALILCPPDVKRQLTGKDTDAGKDGRQKEKGVAEDEMVRLHYRLGGHEWIWANSWRQWRTEEPGVL